MLIVDLDEVLCDFVGGACKVHGWTKERLNKQRVNGEWLMRIHMGMTEEEFWQPINKLNRNFWQNLQPLPWFHALIELLDEVDNDWRIATSPSNDIESYFGKLLWIETFIPDKLHKTWVTQHKHELGKSGRYLLDDRQETLDKFESEGGTGLLFSVNADDPVVAVRYQLQTLGLLK